MELLHFDILADNSQLEQFKSAHKIETTVNYYEEELLELFLVRNPQYKFNKDYQIAFEEFKTRETAGEQMDTLGNWFYFPWNKTLLHHLPELQYFELRTARNRNLITQDEQEKYYNSTIAIAGLSVGSHAAATLAMTGGAKNIKLADFDVVSVSNLNRLRYGSSTIGSNKALVAAHLVADINPYAKIYVYETGITQESITDFIEGSNNSPKSDILIEGVDNLEMKILLREAAKKSSIPVIMATDNGDGIIVDVERYDQDPNLQLFNGALGDFTIETFRNFPPHELPKLATTVAGPNYIVPRMLSSLLQVGRTLYSWPQLGTAATFTGVACAYICRAILNGKNIKGGKYDINLDSIFDPDYQTSQGKEKIKTERKNLLKQMGL